MDKINKETIEKSLRKTYKERILSKFTKAVKIYKLVNENDKIAVCISGGKDLFLLAKLFQELKNHKKYNFDVEFIVMDPGYKKENRQLIEDNAKLLGIPIKIFENNIFESVVNIENSPCYLCARMRRGYLYSYAKSLGCNKIALGHHFDDVIETILMGMLYGAQVQTMMPKLHSTNFEGMELIRPLYLVREADIINFSEHNGLKFLQCACKFTEQYVSEDEKENKSKRKEIKQLIKTLKNNNPYIEMNIFRSVEAVNLETIIGYKKDGKITNFLDNYDNKTI